MVSLGTCALPIAMSSVVQCSCKHNLYTIRMPLLLLRTTHMNLAHSCGSLSTNGSSAPAANTVDADAEVVPSLLELGLPLESRRTSRLSSRSEEHTSELQS